MTQAIERIVHGQTKHHRRFVTACLLLAAGIGYAGSLSLFGR